MKVHAASAKQAQMEAEKLREAARREAEEVKQKARAMQEQAKKSAEAAEKRIQEERAARQKLEADLKNGVQPVEWPNSKQVDDAKRKYQYREGIFHFAIAGISGSGKSSLINALCGYSNKHPNAARTGIVETTSVVARFPDPDPQHPFAWYDVPGAGTLDIPDWQYFNNHGLYVFDAIIVLFDNRFTATDVAILKNCQRFNIPSYIVRSKSNQHIQNVVSDLMEKLDDEDEDEADTVQKRRTELYPTARDTFIKQTRQNVTVNLHKAGLPHQKTYLVSKDAMLSIIKGKVPREFIDEYDLLKDILSEAKARRLGATGTDA
jgi:flagellar biosynthesis GTPase FlhF